MKRKFPVAPSANWIRDSAQANTHSSACARLRDGTPFCRPDTRHDDRQVARVQRDGRHAELPSRNLQLGASGVKQLVPRPGNIET